MNNDLVTLVDEKDNVVGEMNKVEAHRGDGVLHRASSVFLFRKNHSSQKIELLLQKRSENKIVGAHQWGNTVCGNVWPTENYLDCAERRLQNELGIDTSELLLLEDVYNFSYHVRCNEEFSEREIDHVFFALPQNNELIILPSSQEVSDYLWVEWNDLMSNVDFLGIKASSPEAKSIDVLSNGVGYNILLNPWTLIMLSDGKLISIFEAYFNKHAIR